jgi:hypothetical protein
VPRILCWIAAAGVVWGADTTPPSLEIRTLEIHVIEGDGAVYGIGSRATGGVTVLVRDERGQPVEGATVSFSLPAEGPSGVFASGSRTEISATHADGRATAWGMQWNRVAGPFEIRIAAVKGQARAAMVSQQKLVPASAAAAGSRVVKTGGGHHKILWISLAVAGAAVAGVAGSSMGKSSSTATATTTGAGATQIGPPTISLGHP